MVEQENQIVSLVGNSATKRIPRKIANTVRRFLYVPLPVFRGGLLWSQS